MAATAGRWYCVVAGVKDQWRDVEIPPALKRNFVSGVRAHLAPDKITLFLNEFTDVQASSFARRKLLRSAAMVRMIVVYSIEIAVFISLMAFFALLRYYGVPLLPVVASLRFIPFIVVGAGLLVRVIPGRG